MKIARAVAVTLCLVQLGVLCGACSASHKAAPRNPGPPASTGSAAGTLVVLASTQLKPAFEQLDTQFAAANPGVAVTATYQGSQALATAVQAGAQGDLFATDADPMAALAAAGAVVTPTVQTFARNELEIVVPAGNPKAIQRLADLANPGMTLVLADPSLPAGRDAVTALALAGVRVTPKASVSTVALLMTAVLSGNADAGIDAYKAGNYRLAATIFNSLDIKALSSDRAYHIGEIMNTKEMQPGTVEIARADRGADPRPGPVGPHRSRLRARKLSRAAGLDLRSPAAGRVTRAACRRALRRRW